MSDKKKKKQPPSASFRSLTLNESTAKIEGKFPEEEDLCFGKIEWRQQGGSFLEAPGSPVKVENNMSISKYTEGYQTDNMNIVLESVGSPLHGGKSELGVSWRKRIGSKRLETTEKKKKRISFVSFFAMVGRIVGFARRIKEKAFYKNIYNLKTLQLGLIADKAYFSNSFFENEAISLKSRQVLFFENYEEVTPMVNVFKNKLSIVSDQKKKANTEDSIIGKIKKTAKKFKLFHPLNKLLFLWKLLICVFILFEFFKITVKLFIDQYWDQNYEFIPQFEILLKLLLISDILVVSNTAIFKSGVPIFNRKTVLKNYLGREFVFDILALIVLFLPFYSDPPSNEHIPSLRISSWNFIKFGFFFKLKEFTELYKWLEEMSYNNESYEGLLSLFKLLLHIVIISHIIACLWFSTASYEKSNGVLSWLDNTFYLESQTPVDWSTAYLYSWYWSLATMITVGYGDISPRNEKEVIVASLSMIFGCGFFAYAINSIGSIVEGFNVRKQNLKVVNKYMNSKLVDFDLQVRVRKYLEHLWMVEEIENKEFEARIIQNLSKSLKEELLIQAQGRALAKFPLFTSTFSEEVLEKASQIIETVHFAPEDPIIYDGDHSNDLIYFIIKGEIEMYHQMPTHEFRHLSYLKEGDCFGQKSFFTEQDRDFSARSVGFSTIYTIQREKFLEILKNYSLDFEKFHLIKDKIQLYGNVSSLGLQCESCSSGDHIYKCCPFLKFIPQKELIIRRHIRTENNARSSEFVRKQQEKSDSALLLKSRYKNESNASFQSDSEEDEDENENEGESEIESQRFSEKAIDTKAKMERRKSIFINDKTDQAEIEQFFQREFDENSSIRPHNEGAIPDDPILKNKFKREEKHKRSGGVPQFPSEDFRHEDQIPSALQKNKFGDDFEVGSSNSKPIKYDRVTRLLTKKTTGSTIGLKDKMNSSLFDRSTTTVDTNLYFRKDVPLIFGGLNIDMIKNYSIYFPYNNSSFIIEFQKKNHKRSWKRKSRLKSDKFTHSRPSASHGAFGLIEFRNQQRFFMANKTVTKNLTSTNKITGKRAGSLFRRRSKFLTTDNNMKKFPK